MSSSPLAPSTTAEAPPAPPRYTVAVRALCEFTAKAGDLDLRFVPSPTGQEGVAGHGVVTGRRPDGYETEISLSTDYAGLHVRGRADGYDPAANRLEEIKTVRGDGEVPGNHRALHWAQAKVYGWLLCQARGLEAIEVAVVYFDIVSQRERAEAERFEAAALRVFFEATCERFLQWSAQELAHRAARDAALAALTFPHGTFRPGQRALAEGVYRANASGRCLLAQAPTGIGKSVGTLFPALKAMPGQGLDKVFFLSARSTGRSVALEAADKLRRHAGTLPLRVAELVARDKACEHPGSACHGDACPLARGFYDRLPAARQAAMEEPVHDRATVRALALSHEICPYYLSQELARWSDVLVADYNYFFDRSALLHAYTAANGWRVGVLVDEAHNLVERARGMYSAELDPYALRGLRRTAPAPLSRPLDKLRRQWSALAKDATGDAADDYHVLPSIPPAFVRALDEFCAATLEHLTAHPTDHDADLQRFYFDALHFSRLAAEFGSHSLFDLIRSAGAKPNDVRLCVRNVIPAPFLRPRFAGAHATTLFSATLDPARYYLDTLGLPASTVTLDIPSPFHAGQLDVHVARRISTRYADRPRSLPAIVNLMAEQYASRPGNYLAFFSSHDYLQQAASLFAERHAVIPIWTQERKLDEAGQSAFIERFAAGGRGIGFAVLGGVFAEGVDLPGDRLIGAFVATLGLPQVNAINEQMRARMEAEFGNGYDYTYLYPGLRKVVQAAGRVIRTEEDRGVVYLIDDRFGRAEVAALLPRWWRPKAWLAPAKN